jgi:hypothetical protein
MRPAQIVAEPKTCRRERHYRRMQNTLFDLLVDNDTATKTWETGNDLTANVEKNVPADASQRKSP